MVWGDAGRVGVAPETGADDTSAARAGSTCRRGLGSRSERDCMAAAVSTVAAVVGKQGAAAAAVLSGSQSARCVTWLDRLPVVRLIVEGLIDFRAHLFGIPRVAGVVVA